MRAAYLVVYYNGRVHKIQSAYAIITGHAGTGESKWQSGAVVASVTNEKDKNTSAITGLAEVFLSINYCLHICYTDDK
jgi:hypothetical protein